MNNSGDESIEMNEMMAAQMGGGAHHHGQFQHHHHQSEREKSLKKGPWTAAEDAILMEYVEKYGEGNWNAVQKNSGLMRCGKSCRLRWANHLRPNLKKGSLTPEEERIIIELHAKFGNKWARMASQLPGRTDNEIKNYWNTRMKRRQRAGLPIYPHDLHQEAAAAYRHQQAQLLLQRRNNNTNTSAFTSLLSSSHPRKPSYGSNPPLSSLYDQMSYDASTLQNHPDSRSYSNPAMTVPYNGDGGFASPLSPVSPFGSSSSALFSQVNLPSQTLMTTPSQYYNSGHVGFGGNYNSPSLSSMLMGAPPYEPLKPELPSNQTSPYSPVTPASFNRGESYIEAASGNTNDYEIETETYLGKRSNGLLDDVLEQARTMSRTKRSRNGDSSSGESGKDKYVVEEDEEDVSANVGEEEDNVQDESTWKSSGDNSAENHRDGSSSPSIGMKPSEDPLEEMDEDLLSLLNFSSATPVSADSWYMGGMSSQSSSGMNGSAGGMNVSQDVQQSGSTMGSLVNASAAELDDEVKRSLPPCFWNNFPSMSGIC